MDASSKPLDNQIALLNSGKFLPVDSSFIKLPPKSHHFTGFYSICMNYLNWDIQVMLGIATATSVRVSNELGVGHSMLAKFSIIVVTVTSILVNVVFTIIVLIFRVGLGKVFTNDSQVIQAWSSLALLLAISVILSGTQMQSLYSCGSLSRSAALETLKVDSNKKSFRLKSCKQNLT